MGGRCSFGRCVEVVAARTASELALDGVSVYWTIAGDSFTPTGVVESAPLLGGAVTRIASAQLLASDLEVSNGYVYWANQGTTGAGAIMRAPVSGGGSTLVASEPNNDAIAIAVDATHVYWGSFHQTGSAVRRVLTSGGAATTLSSEPQRRPSAVVVDGSFVYWTRYAEGSLARMPLAGGTVTPLVQGVPQLHTVTRDGQFLYFANSSLIQRVRSDGTSPLTLVQGASAGPQYGFDLAVDATHVYWSDSSGIYRIPLAGGTREQLWAAANSTESPRSSPVVNATHVYWATEGGVLRRTK